MKEFYKANFVSVFYDPGTDALWVKYFQNVPSDKEFIEVVDAMLEGFKQSNTQKFIADIRKMGIIGVDSQKLIIDKLIPGMINHLQGKKLYHAQLINPVEIMAKITANNVKRKSVSDSVEIVQFTDENEAVAYLKCIE